jgi:hypothetical protein
MDETVVYRAIAPTSGLRAATSARLTTSKAGDANREIGQGDRSAALAGCDRLIGVSTLH